MDPLKRVIAARDKLVARYGRRLPSWISAAGIFWDGIDGWCVKVTVPAGGLKHAAFVPLYVDGVWVVVHAVGVEETL